MNELLQFSKLPVLQFYAFGCALLGSVVATVATGSGMCNPRRTGPRGPQNGLQTWGDKLTDMWKLWVMRQRYGNEDEAIDILRQTEKEFAETHFPEDIQQLDAQNFSMRALLVGPHN